MVIDPRRPGRAGRGHALRRQITRHEEAIVRYADNPKVIADRTQKLNFLRSQLFKLRAQR